MLNLNPNSSDPFGVLNTTKNVLQKAKYVELISSKTVKISKLIGEKLKNGLDESEYGLGLSGVYETDTQLLLVEDAVNFCFWAEKEDEKWKVEWPKGKIISGGWYSLLAVFERAIAENVPILNPKYLSELTIEDVRKIFRSASKSEIPLIEKRLENLIETGNILVNKFDGKFINLLDEANFDAINIVKMLYDNFPSFRDMAEYDDKKVYFLKRAQILANDLSYVTKNGKQVNIKNIDRLTAFADYKIPQILRNFGIISYNKELAEKVDNFVLIPSLSPEEVEIRAAAVQGIDLIKQNLKIYTSSQIDNAIWLISQDQSKIEKPYHRTYSIFY